jgi:hypothetical protein
MQTKHFSLYVGEGMIPMGSPKVLGLCSWAIALEVATLKIRITMQKYKRMTRRESFPNFEIPTWPVDYVGIERKFQLPNIKHHQNF